MKLRSLSIFLAGVVTIFAVCVATNLVRATNQSVPQLSRSEHTPTTSPNRIQRTEPERDEIPGTDQEMRMYLIVYPPGVSAPLHHHPVVGLGYILAGSAESAFGSDKPQTYHAGQSFQDQAMIPHTI